MMTQPLGNSPHFSVLWRESLEALNLRAGGRYIDGTLGAGGHAFGILERIAPDGQLLGLDVDSIALEIARKRLEPFSDNAKLVQSNFSGMAQVARELNFSPVQGVLLDLGVSSMQLDNPARGFSFQGDGPLDMRLGETQGDLTAARIVNEWREEDLVKIFFEVGEEPQARRFARAIVETRQHAQFKTTLELAHLLQRVSGGRSVGREKKPIHPATKVFQALRITVNRELENLRSGLDAAMETLEPGGRLVVITFHSLEDRIVKHFIRDAASERENLPGVPVYLAQAKIPTLKIITKKPLEAGTEEQASNRRSRSAKLRIAEKI
ncbi:MAG: 16S rRNA (cytosine(1402)-N(4))-methyltransferase RsmH [Chloroflexi bacterium]|uniref:Ribosomal RNA small subunit methyltransferase H n=1 Tax=Candidatus Chlorohelix allophototropha TaxID=3003348 RepID=A0A8T7LYG9_9CHLR|nr:16S rRNA (cytosine(1402)-N(4))-methyltransferase RsmH [Chloroflexota bacterium]WJW66372.1 16S rRNA (cytosine(1402)-N(4))-methyltransferase RsmH [Chloroflexota bacterium L227-S17]